MKKYILFLSLFSLVLFSSCDDNMYTSLEHYSGEIVYPAKHDTIFGAIGYKRVEIDLSKQGRVPAEDLVLGKANRTVVEFDGPKTAGWNDSYVIKDYAELRSWLSIDGLWQSKLYRFKVYTLDEFDNKSVTQEIALIPYTDDDADLLVMPIPRTMMSTSSAIVDWPSGLSSVLLDYVSFKYEYTDKDGVKSSGERIGSDTRFFVSNLVGGQPATIKMKYKVIPKVSGNRIIDTIEIDRDLVLNLPTNSTVFSPATRTILQENGVTTFTADGVSAITELVFPMHTSSLQDLFYFPNVTKVDLTGGTLFATKLPQLDPALYTGNGANSVIGTTYFPFLIRQVAFPAGEAQALVDLLEAGRLTEVKYRPGSMANMDAILAPYVASGVVKLTDMSTLPTDVIVDKMYWIDGRVQTNDFRIDVTNAPSDAPALPAGTLLQNVYKLELKGRSSSFIFGFPKDYKFDIETYPYVKVKLYAPAASKFTGNNENYKKIWFRIRRGLWNFASGDNAQGGSGEWNANDIVMADFQVWKEISVDLTPAKGNNPRLIVMNIGHEPSNNSDGTIVYYAADMKFSKNP